MKKMLFRKLLMDYMSFFLIALFSSSIVIWVFQAVNFLDIMIEDGRDYKIYISYSLLNFPKIINKIFPFVLFFSLFHLTIKYENNNELLIFWTFGITKIELTNFIKEDRAQIQRLNNVIDIKQREIDDLHKQNMDLLWSLAKMEKRLAEAEKVESEVANYEKKITKFINEESVDN